MITEFGHFALILALFVALVQSALVLTDNEDPRIMRLKMCIECIFMEVELQWWLPSPFVILPPVNFS